MRVMIISQPKAGTYLCANILKELGLKFTGIHIGEHKYERYPEPNHPRYKEVLKNPKLAETKCPMEESVKLVRDGHFGVGHFLYNEEAESILQPFLKILLTRPDVEIFESILRWNEYSGRKRINRYKTLGRLRSIEGWLDRPDVFHMTFADMKNINESKLEEMLTFLKIEKQFDLMSVCKIAMAKPSKTKIS